MVKNENCRDKHGYISKLKKIYPLACIMLFVSSFLFLFRNNHFIADQEFLFMVFPQTVIRKHIGFFGNLWNSYSGCGVPFFPQPWGKFYFPLSAFFYFFDLKTAYILFLSSGFIIAYFALYYLAKYFYKDRYIAIFLSLLYVSSGLIYGYFSNNYYNIEFYIIMPFLVMAVHKYINRENIKYLILIAILSLFIHLGALITALLMFYLVLNLFIVFFAYEKHKSLSKIFWNVFLINITIISVNLFKIIPMAQYYFVEGTRLPSLYIPVGSFLDFMGSLHFIFLTGEFPINLHYTYLFLLMAYLFYPKNLIERVSFRTFTSFILIVTFSYTVLRFLDFNLTKTLSLYKLFWVAHHLPGTLMLGIGVRAFIVSSDRKRELKALMTFVAGVLLLYSFSAIRKHSFNVGFIQYAKSPLLFALTFSFLILISRNIRVRKFCALAIVLIYGMAFIHTAKSYWATNNTYQKTYLGSYNKEISEALGTKSPANFTYNKVDDMYRIMSHRNGKSEILESFDINVYPYFSTGNYPILFGVSTIHQHDNVFLRRYATFIELLEGSGDINSHGKGDVLLSPLFPLLNVKYIFSYDPVYSEGFSLCRELTDKKTKIYKNNNMLPRLFVVDRYVPCNSKEDFVRILDKGDINFSKTILIEGYTATEDKDKTPLDYKIKSFNYKNDSIKLEVDVNKGSFLAILDNYYPGWRAYVNGKEAPIYPAYMTFRAIRLPAAGSYAVELKYCPVFFKEGILISAAVFIFMFLGWRRQQ